jgi:hypothetical protein
VLLYTRNLYGKTYHPSPTIIHSRKWLGDQPFEFRGRQRPCSINPRLSSMIAAHYKYAHHDRVLDQSQTDTSDPPQEHFPNRQRPPPMAVEGGSTAPALPLPPRLSASSPPTVGTLLTRASAAGAPRARECSSPRSLLSRILHRGRGGGGSGFGCRLRLLPRYCTSGAAAKEHVATAREDVREEPREAAALPNVVRGQPAPRESPRNSLGTCSCPWCSVLAPGIAPSCRQRSMTMR